MDCILQKNHRKIFVLIDCLADSGVAEMYTADEHKMAVSPPSKRQYLYCGAGKQNQLLKSKEVTVRNMENMHLEDSWNSFNRQVVSCTRRTQAGLQQTLTQLRWFVKLQSAAQRWHTFNQAFSFNRTVFLHTGALQ
jgi:hypothetical protein